VLATIALQTLLALPAAVVLAKNNSFSAGRLDGAHEVPARITNANGHARFRLSHDGNSLSYRLEIKDISNVFQAHIHMAPEGANGPIVAWLYPTTAPTPGPVGCGPVEEIKVSGVLTAANLVGPLAGKSLSDLIDVMESRNAYVNVHTNDGKDPANTGPGDFPGGEIRNQIRAQRSDD
jgi:hypothetical protein